MVQIQAYAAHAPKARLTPCSYAVGEPLEGEVEVEVSCCGLCHSDIHLIDDDWKISAYPLIPGHEVVGTVRAMGKRVRGLKVGERVGIGWQCGSCGTCEFCRRGAENFCSASRATCVGRSGGFAQALRVDARFAFPIPKKLASEHAAPLLCGGLTVYSPLVRHAVGRGTRCAVLGMGGLGHLAVQFASKLGAHTTVFSSSPDKEAEARGLGAAEFRSDGKPPRGAYDFILSTVSADLDFRPFLAALRPEGSLCFVGASPSPLKLQVFDLIHGAKNVCGSPIGGRKDMRRMLDFAARRGVRPIVEVLPMDQVNEAVLKVRANKARYRMVLRRES
ncbi:MAG: NAD(P)-dependent alcohol dehydrogenase [Elusimicrobiota bacterium]|jgi:uncharacterized zinc-type alcohol dehydrogenase-like protein